jgi:hypothetical protein
VNIYIKKTLVILFVMSKITLFSQEQLGLRLENYAGANGTTLNPTHSADYPLSFNLNLAGIGFFVDNSYGYISNSKIPSLIKNEKELLLGPVVKQNRPEGSPVADFYRGKKAAFVFFNTIINGPAFSVKLGKSHTVGLFYNYRFGASAAHIPTNLKFYILDAKNYNEFFEVEKFGGAVMAWNEIGANYAYKGETNDGFFQIGLNIKYLRGNEGFWAKSNDAFRAARLFGDSLKLNVPSISYGFTDANFENVVNKTYKLQNLGQGLGFDIGFSYLIENNDYDDYALKFSASILDIGRVKFTQNTQEHLIVFPNARILDVKAFDKVTVPATAPKLASYQLIGDSSKTLVAKTFSIGLPTALCLQADYQFLPHAFANATLIQRVPYQAVGIRRGNLLALSARYEQRWFSFCLPIQLYEYQRVRLGFAARLACLTIGTDYLGSFIRKNNFTGTDFYFAIKLNPLNLNIDTSHWFDGFGKRGKNVDCYKF